MQRVKTKIPKKFQKGIPLSIRRGHTVRLEVTEEPLTVHTGLSLFYAMADALKIPQALDQHIHVKQREAGYPESEHILTLSGNAFIGGDYLDDLEAIREDAAIQMAIGRKEIPDPTTAGDFCRRFSLGHIFQVEKAFREIQRTVYTQRKNLSRWTIDIDAKVHEVYGAKKEGAAKAYNGTYSLQPMYAFVDETDEMIQAQLRPGNTHPGDRIIPFLRRMKKKIPSIVKDVNIRSDSAAYNKEVIAFCEREGWGFTITADQTAPLMDLIYAIPGDDWQVDKENPSIAYSYVWYQAKDWPKKYRYLVRREKIEDKTGQGVLIENVGYSYYAVVANREGDVKMLMELHDKRGRCEKRIGQFTNEFLLHLPMGEFMANWVYLLCAQLAYNLSLWIRDLLLPQSYRKKHIKRIRRCIGLIASKVTSGGHQIRLKLSILHRWWKDFIYAWQMIPSLKMAINSG